MATAGRFPPGETVPSYLPQSTYRPFTQDHSLHTTPAELLAHHRNNPTGHRPPGYLPQAEDYLKYPTELKPLGPLDHAAHGRTDYAYEEGATGLKPIVDAFSITRFSPAEWRRHNQDLLVRSHDAQNRCDRAEWYGLETIENIRVQTDTTQSDNTDRLRQREQEIFAWRVQLEDAIERMAVEIDLLRVERKRLQNAMQMVLIPMSIARESLHRRNSRVDIELVRDEVEETLTVEMALSGEIKELLERTLRELELRMIENTSAKRQLEYDWAEKARAHQLETVNVGLRNRSTTIQFKHGSCIFPNDQSTVELWNKFVKDIVEQAAGIRRKSEKFRATLDALLIHAARDLRTQADKVEIALSTRIADTHEMRRQLEIELKKVMRKIADAEAMFPKIKQSMQQLDYPMKVAQTRLDNKSIRPKVENCRDISQYGLINEVKLINDSVAELRERLAGVEKSHASLQTLRADLERDIMVKSKSLQIDRGIHNDVRTRFPSATELTGYIERV